jgi:putative ABC transport system ATP-binding protein
MKNSKDAVLKVDNIKKIYKMGSTEVRAVDGISLELNREDFIAIMGPSGSGKTTLLDMLSCLLRPTSGEVYINGRQISKMDDSELAKVRGKTIGFIFQTFNLIPRMNAIENVALPLWFAGVPKIEREKRAVDALKDVGLLERIRHKPNELSGGQRQRVAIARALVVDPDIIVADEPTGNLDSESGAKIMEILTDLHEKKSKTILMVTHEKDIAAYADKIIYIKDGKISNTSTRR